MTVTRAGKTATLLRDGRVLFTGGYNCAPAGQDGLWATAELYDPATGTFSPTGSMKAPPLEFHTATLLADGRVLIAGGQSRPQPDRRRRRHPRLHPDRGQPRPAFSQTAEVYDPATGTFSQDRVDEPRSGTITRRRCSRTAGSS